MGVENCECRAILQQGRSVWQRLAAVLVWFGREIERREQLARQRQQLLEMDDRLLKDIGLSRVDAERIARQMDVRDGSLRRSSFG